MVESERLLIHVSKQMKGLNATLGAADAALQTRPNSEIKRAALHTISFAAGLLSRAVLRASAPSFSVGISPYFFVGCAALRAFAFSVLTFAEALAALLAIRRRSSGERFAALFLPPIRPRHRFNPRHLPFPTVQR
jgi:hypothetical protein